MKTVAPSVASEKTTEIDEEFFGTPLTAEQAQRLRRQNPPTSPWRVVLAQLVVGAVVAGAAWIWTGQRSVGWSMAYGALAVSIPAAVFARGLTGRISSLNVATAAAAFMVWEMVKVALTVAMLAAAPRLVPELSWPAMLIGLVVTMQVYWAAPMLAPRKTKNIDE